MRSGNNVSPVSPRTNPTSCKSCLRSGQRESFKTAVVRQTVQKTCSAGKAPQAARPGWSCGRGSAQIAQSRGDWLNEVTGSTMCRREGASSEAALPWSPCPGVGDEVPGDAMARQRGNTNTKLNAKRVHPLPYLLRKSTRLPTGPKRPCCRTPPWMPHQPDRRTHVSQRVQNGAIFRTLWPKLPPEMQVSKRPLSRELGGGRWHCSICVVILAHWLRKSWFGSEGPAFPRQAQQRK